MVAEIRGEEYEPWFTPVMETLIQGELPGEVESLLFCVQTGIGVGIMAFVMGRFVERKKWMTKQKQLNIQLSEPGNCLRCSIPAFFLWRQKKKKGEARNVIKPVVFFSGIIKKKPERESVNGKSAGGGRISREAGAAESTHQII